MDELISMEKIIKTLAERLGLAERYEHVGSAGWMNTEQIKEEAQVEEEAEQEEIKAEQQVDALKIVAEALDVVAEAVAEHQVEEEIAEGPQVKQ